MNRFLAALCFAITMPGGAYAGNAEVAATQRPATNAEINGILEGMRNFLHDPYSVRDVEISGVMTFINSAKGVCVRGNAKNAYGAYTGRQTYLVYLDANGRAYQTNQDFFAQGLCRFATWRPFTEARALQNL